MIRDNTARQLSLRISWERYSDSLAAELTPLLMHHWQEIGQYQLQRPLDVYWPAYQKADEMGMMLCLTARLAGNLIGYCVFFLTRSPHYHTTLWGVNDVLYVVPEQRNSRIGLTLINEAIRELRARGCRRITWHVKMTNADGSPNPLYRILLRKGFQDEERILGWCEEDA